MRELTAETDTAHAWKFAPEAIGALIHRVVADSSALRHALQRHRPEAGRLLGAIRNAGPDGIAKTVLVKNARCTHLATADVDAMLEALQQRGFIATLPPSTKRGRPAERWITANEV